MITYTFPQKILICFKSLQQSRYVHKNFANYLVGLVKRVKIRIRQDTESTIRTNHSGSTTLPAASRLGYPPWCQKLKFKIPKAFFETLKSEGNRSRVQRKISPNYVILLITTLFLLKHVKQARNFISHPNKRNVNTHILIIFHDWKISASTLSYSQVQQG